MVEATADDYSQDPQIAWKNLSTDASMTYTGAGSPVTSSSHGPKVIPKFGGYETARYGDRPFPVVPVDYSDRSHDDATAPSSLLNTKINDPANPGSTFNLYQEISYGQLFPDGAVPSDGIATADWTYGPGFDFTQLDGRDEARHLSRDHQQRPPRRQHLPDASAPADHQRLVPDARIH